MKNVWIMFFTCILLCTNISCQMQKTVPKKRIDKKIVSAKDSYDFNQMDQDLNLLKKQYPDKMQYFSIGESVEKRPLYMVKIGKGKQKLLVTGAIHGREWMTTYLIMNLIEHYLSVDQKGKSIGRYNVSKLLKKTTIYFMPMVNPDGVDLAINGVGNRSEEKLLEMNEGSNDFQRWKANIRGVDLNRQFNAHWKDVDSKPVPSFENYKGKNPLSQPESYALAVFTGKEKIDIVVAYHLSGDVIFWYYGQKGKQYKRDYRIAKKLSKITGYTLISERESDDIAAGYKDWFIKEFEKPGYTIEIGEKRYNQIGTKYIHKFISENKEAILYLANEVSKMK